MSKSYLWEAMPIVISKDGTLLGSVLYEEVGTSDMILEFYSSSINAPDKDKAHILEYPQAVLPQEWAVSYPLMAYKHFAPDNHKICIINLAQDVP